MSRPETPLEAIYSNEEKGLMAEVEAATKQLPPDADLDEYLRAQWRAAYETESVFRNKLDTTKRRPLPGRWGITLQCDPAQVAAKRAPSTGKVAAKAAGAAPKAVAVYRDFNPAAFNFNKCKQEETLFCLDIPPRASGASGADAADAAGGKSAGEEEASSGKSEEEAAEGKAGSGGLDGDAADGTALTAPPHAVLVNVSPLLEMHSLLLLYMREGLPQVLSPDVLVLALKFMGLIRRRDVRLGFNSLGGFSSVNHLHFQILALQELEQLAFPCESAPRVHLWHCRPPPDDESEAALAAAAASAVVSVAEIAEWPVRGFHLACRDEHDAQALADVAGTLLCVLLVNSIPHNVLIGRGGLEMFIFPRRPQAPCGGGAFNAAFCEIAGLAILVKPELFDTVTESDYLAAMAEASLTVDEFVWLKGEFLEACGGGESPATGAVASADGEGSGAAPGVGGDSVAAPAGDHDGKTDDGDQEIEEEKKGGSA